MKNLRDHASCACHLESLGHVCFAIGACVEYLLSLHLLLVESLDLVVAIPFYSFGFYYANFAWSHPPVEEKLGPEAPQDGDAQFLLEYGSALRFLSKALGMLPPQRS